MTDVGYRREFKSFHIHMDWMIAWKHSDDYYRRWFSVAINSLAPGRPGCHFKTAIFNLLSIGIFTSSDDNPLRWMPWDLADDNSTLVQVMAWCNQATRLYQNQCWPRPPTPYGVTRPQWVKLSVYQLCSRIRPPSLIWSAWEIYRGDWVMISLLICIWFQLLLTN